MKNYGVKIRDLISLITKNSDDYYKKNIKIKFNSNGERALNEKIEIPTVIIVVEAVFHKNNKYYLQVLLDEYLYKL